MQLSALYRCMNVIREPLSTSEPPINQLKSFLRDRYYQLCCVMIEKVGHRQVLSIIIDSRYAMTYVADFVLCSRSVSPPSKI